MKQLKVNTAAVSGVVSPLLRGACMEDVNHELYGGIWSQMIFGEAFEEPAVRDISCDLLTAFGSTWELCSECGGIFCKAESDGPKVVFENTELADGTVSADITLAGGGVAGLLCRVSGARKGGDAFTGYEIAVAPGLVRLARHRNNYVNLVDAPAEVAIGDTVKLEAVLKGAEIAVSVNGKELIRYVDEAPVLEGKLGLRAYGTGMKASCVTLNGEAVVLPEEKEHEQVSSMWLPYRTEAAEGEFRLEKGGYNGSQEQIISCSSGEIGVYNRGLNRSGMYFAADKDYNGYLYISAVRPVRVTVSLRNADCSVVYASETFTARGGWKKYAFTLVPDAEEINGSFLVSVSDGEAKLGYAFLEMGEWGRYKGLHVRRDVGEGLENMGINLLRFGGCMANAEEYLWKKMTGEPEDRVPYRGWWYPYSSFGFGILEFIELCEKLGVACVPDFNGYETEEDMRDFVRYALGTDENDEWVQLRLQSSHPQPYQLEYIQFGNEETVDEAFADRFIAACRGVWSVAPQITMVVGDFDYNRHPFDDPWNIPPECTAKGLPNLNPHKRMMDYAMEAGQNGKVWFDIHWWSEHGTTPLPFPECAWNFHKQLGVVTPGTKSKIVVYELNANSHDWERTMANATSIIEAMKHSEILPCMSSANCLQVDKHNDNSWNQGLLFMNNRSVWYQSAGLFNSLTERVWLGQRYEFNDEIVDAYFNAVVMTQDGKISVVLLNRKDEEEEIEIDLPVYAGKTYEYQKTVMAYDKKAVNTESDPEFIKIPDAEICTAEGRIAITMPANSIITLAL